jgi:hypothetical protein
MDILEDWIFLKGRVSDVQLSAFKTAVPKMYLLRAHLGDSNKHNDIHEREKIAFFLHGVSFSLELHCLLSRT